MAPVAARDPAVTVETFYSLVADHRFVEAAALWTQRLRDTYPPAEYIDARFEDTTKIAVKRIDVTRASGSTATVAVDILEFRDVAPTVRELSLSWTLVKLSGRWYIDGWDS